MRGLAALCALALAGCAAEDLDSTWARCAGAGDPNQRLLACTAVVLADEAAPERRAAALVARGEVRLGASQHARAIADFGRALRLDPRNTQALFQRGMAHYERAAYQAAVQDFAAALAADPQHNLAQRWRDDALAMVLADFEDNLAQVDAMIAEAPGDASLLNNRCWLRATHGRDLDLALADCSAALRIEPSSAAVLDSRGLAHYKSGAFEAALADYDAALAIDASRGHYMYGRALALHALGRTEEANVAFAASEKAEPGVGALYYGYGASGPV